MPSFGYTTAGATGVNTASISRADIGASTRYTASTGDVITSFSIRGNDTGSTPISLAVYDFNGTLPVNRVDVASSLQMSSTLGWQTTGTVSIALTGSTTYVVAVGKPAASTAATIYYDTGSGNERSGNDTTGVLGATWSHAAYSTAKISMYATYTTGGGAVSHATSGALTGVASAIAGISVHNTPHDTSGVLAGQTSSIAGSASRSTSLTTHTTSGVLAGSISSVAGSASRYHQFYASGSLTGQSSTISGSAVHKALHSTSGVLTGSASQIVGVSYTNKVHSSVGILLSQPSVMVGVASKVLILATTPSIYTAYAEQIDNGIWVNTLDTTCYVEIYNNKIEI